MRDLYICICLGIVHQYSLILLLILFSLVLRNLLLNYNLLLVLSTLYIVLLRVVLLLNNSHLIILLVSASLSRSWCCHIDLWNVRSHCLWNYCYFIHALVCWIGCLGMMGIWGWDNLGWLLSVCIHYLLGLRALPWSGTIEGCCLRLLRIVLTVRSYKNLLGGVRMVRLHVNLLIIQLSMWLLNNLVSLRRCNLVAWLSTV